MNGATRGPWKAIGNRIETPLYGTSGPSLVIARTAGDDGESCANARLIAAAPELLEALEWLARDADQWSGQVEPPLPALVKAWATIAKAHGEGVHP